MKSAFKSFLFITGIALMAASSSHADSFAYSYLFPSGAVVTGTFSGTEIAGGYVENASDATLFLNGSQVLGPIKIGRQEDVLPPLINYDVSLNIFYLSGGGPFNYTQFGFWYNDQWPLWASLFSPNMFSDPKSAGFEYPINPAHWSLIKTSTASVPDGASAGVLFGITFIGLASLRAARR